MPEACRGCVILRKYGLPPAAGGFPQDICMAKLKLKTHSGAAKRFKKTATGKFKRNRAFARHIFTTKGPARKRRLHQATLVDPADHDRVAEMLPY